MAQRQWRSDDTSTWNYGFGDGSDGDLTISSNTTEAPIDASCSGTSGATSLTATNASFAIGQLILIHQTRGTGAGGWELNKIAGYTAGTITTAHALTMTYTDSGASQAQVRVMKQYNNVTINSGQTYASKAWNGDVGGILGFFAKGTITVTGSISTVGTGYRGGASYSGGEAYVGESTTADNSARSYGASGTGGGGGRGDVGDRSPGGGGGGHAGGGTSGDVSQGNEGGVGGGAVGVASLVTATFGGAGGGGAKGGGETSVPGDGAGSGGLAFIFGSSMTITGSIPTGGGNGGNASGAQNGGGGGGGSGGGVLLKCVTATLGTNLITSTGGSGGSKVVNGGAGGAGSVGRIHLDYSTSYSGSTSPTIDVTNDLTIVDVTTSGSFLVMF